MVGLDESFQPYVLELNLSGQEEEGSSLCMALVVVRKPSAILLAVPVGFFPDEVLEDGMSAGPDEFIGPSHPIEVPGGRLSLMDGAPPVAVPGLTLNVMLVDTTVDVLGHLTPVSEYEGPTGVLILFQEEQPFIYPMKDALVEAAWNWIVHPDALDRILYYSAAEEDEVQEEEMVPDTTTAPQANLPAGPKAPGVAMPSGKAKAKATMAPKPKKPTIASLATSFESVAAALPALTQQITELSQRTKAMEEQMQEPSRLSALSRPLGGSAIGGSGVASAMTASALLKEMPPPQNTRAPRNMAPGAPIPEMEIADMEQGRMMEQPQGEFARAMFAQSTAITALAAQIANMNGDSLGDLAGSSGVFSSKGASGRMKLQQDLASHKGLFFNSVMANMNRRMNPAAASDATPIQLAAQGVTMTRYVERFGGFGKVRDVGQIMWQVALIMDYLQTENWQGAKDATALLSVCLEQTALDGAMDVGLLLSLVEDPPSSLFTNRSLAPLSRGRSFAPLADQKWITVSLSFIKELDLISQRRADMMGGKSQSSEAAPAPKPKVKPQPKPWKKKKKALEDGSTEDA